MNGQFQAVQLFPDSQIKMFKKTDFDLYGTVKRQSGPCGIDKERKKNILKLTRLMNEQDKNYYINLPEMND